MYCSYFAVSFVFLFFIFSFFFFFLLCFSYFFFFFFSSRRRHTRYWRDWSSDVCSSDLTRPVAHLRGAAPRRRGAGRDHHVPTLRAPYVHQPRAAARARAGGAAASGRHAAGPGPGRRSPAPGARRGDARARVPALAARRGPPGHDPRGEPGRGRPAFDHAAAAGGRPAVGVAAARPPRGGGGRLVRGARSARLGRGGAAAGDGGHTEPPARLAPDRAQGALLDRERGGGEVRDRRIE